MAHIASDHRAYLTSALQHDKKPIAILLGAGASMSISVGGSPLIPGLEGLTALVRDRLDEDSSKIVARLESHLGHEETNLESLLGYIRTLASLPGTADVRGIPIQRLVDLDTTICAEVARAVSVDLPAGSSPYRYLAIWMRSVRRAYPVQLFSLNYDLLAEQALEREQVAYFDGFMGSHQPTFDLEAIEEDLLPVRWNLLWKIHGSVNWTRTESGAVIRRAPDEGHPAVIYPSHLKYDQSRRLPHLAMLDRLKTFLRQPGAVLVTCGYSFRDEHVTEVILQSLRTNSTATVEALLYGPLSSYDEIVPFAESVPNLQLLAQDAGVVGGVNSKWASVTETDDVNAALEMDLGDFNQFGELLREVVGGAKQMQQEDSQTWLRTNR